ncbi:MAG: ABC transporter ATP-binding protein [Oscillospiraceae bacterium]
MYAVETVNLHKQYKDKNAVKNLNLKINDGELFGLLGVNGAGKTTTIKMLSGLSEITSGQAIIYGNDVAKNLSEVKPLINVSTQETAVAMNLTVRENLMFIAKIYGFDKKSCIEKVNGIIEDFSLSEVAEKKAKILSGGWQRRLSIAMALISEPKLLFLDEPTLGLDVLARRELWSVISKLKGRITIILTTHYLEEAEALSDRLAIMVDGDIKSIGTAEEIKQSVSCDKFEDAFVKIAERK